MTQIVQTEMARYSEISFMYIHSKINNKESRAYYSMTTYNCIPEMI